MDGINKMVWWILVQRVMGIGTLEHGLVDVNKENKNRVRWLIKWDGLQVVSGVSNTTWEWDVWSTLVKD